MKEIVIISGKGGTGKTFLTAALSYFSNNKIMLDCDVDAANLYLLLGGKIIEEEQFQSARSALIDYDKCTKCGICRDKCRFKALDKNIVLDPLACEGCGLCALVCPQNAIEMVPEINGKVFKADTKYGPFVYAKLKIAAENSGKLVSYVREVGRTVALEKKLDYIIIDGPPGIGCPLIASLTGVNLALIVTEPTYSGIHDMQRVIEVAAHFGIDVKVIINKYDINLENTQKIKDFCLQKNLELLSQIPFSESIPYSLIKAVPYPEYSQDEISRQIAEIWQKIK